MSSALGAFTGFRAQQLEQARNCEERKAMAQAIATQPLLDRRCFRKGALESLTMQEAGRLTALRTTPKAAWRCHRRISQPLTFEGQVRLLSKSKSLTAAKPRFLSNEESSRAFSTVPQVLGLSAWAPQSWGDLGCLSEVGLSFYCSRGVLDSSISGQRTLVSRKRRGLAPRVRCLNRRAPELCSGGTKDVKAAQSPVSTAPPFHRTHRRDSKARVLAHKLVSSASPSSPISNIKQSQQSHPARSVGRLARRRRLLLLRPCGCTTDCQDGGTTAPGEDEFESQPSELSAEVSSSKVSEMRGKEEGLSLGVRAALGALRFYKSEFPLTPNLTCNSALCSLEACGSGVIRHLARSAGLKGSQRPKYRLLA